MTDPNEPDDGGKRFLTAFFELIMEDPVKNKLSGKKSMYDVGQKLGIDRDEAAQTAELLMGMGLVEVRTLAGDIGLTAVGLEKAEGLTGASARTGIAATLGNEPVLDDTGKAGVENLIAEIKTLSKDMGMDFDAAAELIADIKTLEAQLFSPCPKTGIIRECLYSLDNNLAKNAAKAGRSPVEKIGTLLGK